jgi:hypothetical protein
VTKGRVVLFKRKRPAVNQAEGGLANRSGGYSTPNAQRSTLNIQRKDGRKMTKRFFRH